MSEPKFNENIDAFLDELNEKEEREALVNAKKVRAIDASMENDDNELKPLDEGFDFYETKMTEPKFNENIDAFLDELNEKEEREALVNAKKVRTMENNENELKPLDEGFDEEESVFGEDEESEAAVDDFYARYNAWSTKFWALKRKFGWKSFIASGIFLKGIQRFVQNPEMERNMSSPVKSDNETPLSPIKSENGIQATTDDPLYEDLSYCKKGESDCYCGQTKCNSPFTCDLVTQNFTGTCSNICKKEGQSGCKCGETESCNSPFQCDLVKQSTNGGTCQRECTKDEYGMCEKFEYNKFRVEHGYINAKYVIPKEIEEQVKAWCCTSDEVSDETPSKKAPKKTEKQNIAMKKEATEMKVSAKKTKKNDVIVQPKRNQKAEKKTTVA